MSGPAPDHVPEVPGRYMIAVLGGVALLSGLLLVVAYQGTLPRVTEAKQRAVAQAMNQVLPGTVSRRTFAVTADGLRRVPDDTTDGNLVYAGYDASGRLLGIAAEAAGQGYADVVRVLYGYTPDHERIVGLHVLRNKDTPGIGDRISRDPAFLANFKALDARLNPEQSGLAHPIVTVKHGRKTEPWQIDAISGATVTSRAVGRMLDQSAQGLLPKVARQLDTLRQANTP